MDLLNKMRTPIFLKEDSDTQKYIQNLKDIKEQSDGNIKSIIDKEIRLASSGLTGEDNIAFELKNCDMPIYVLRDLHIECDDVSAQIDYAVVTKKFILFIECKNLIGDIEIDSQGNFIRTYELYGKKIREGIYSPITQNQRHLDVMKRIMISKQPNKIMEFAAEKLFNSMYKSVVVLANPKTILDDKFAPKSVKDKVIRADQLGTYIKNIYKSSKEPICNDKQLLAQAENLLSKHKPNETDYIKKYQTIVIDKDKYQSIEENTVISHISNQSDSRGIDIENLTIELKRFRLNKSRAEDIKPYFIFNNKQMEHLLEVLPKTKIELQEVNGFGPVKAERYGDEIIEIIQKFVY